MVCLYCAMGGYLLLAAAMAGTRWLKMTNATEGNRRLRGGGCQSRAWPTRKENSHETEHTNRYLLRIDPAVPGR